MIVTITEMIIAATAGMTIVAMTIAVMTTVVMTEAMTEATTANTIMVSTTTASRMGTGTVMAKITKHLRYGLLAAVVGLHALPVWAEDVGNVAKQNTVSAPQAELAWMSGGIGDEARDEMRKAAAAYSVHMVFSDREGSYLAGIPFVVTRPNGKELYAGVSAGPLLYLKLPPGSYQISAQFDGVWHKKSIRAGTAADPARVSFVSIGK